MTDAPDTQSSWPWPAGSATGIGSLPGSDIVEAVKWTLGELPDLPYLPELPARGPGSEIIGRGAGLLVELPVEVYAGRWRIAARPGRDLRRTRDLLDRDLDALTEQAAEWTGSIKVQSAGAFTLAAGIDLPVGGRVLRDPGAVRELTASLAEGLRLHVADLRRRLPKATILVQLDEPSLPAVLAGQVPSESGWQTLRAVEASVARERINSIVEAVGAPVVLHCCAARVPLGLLRAAGVAAVSVDLDQVGDLDAVGELLDAGVGLFAGVAATASSSGAAPSSAALADRVREFWARLGFPAERLPAQVVLSPACGLAGASADYARAVLAACVEAGRRIVDEPARRPAG